MPNTPKKIENKIEKLTNSWRTLAPSKSFGGMTLAQFQAFADASIAARQTVSDLSDQLTLALNQRDDADRVFLEKAQLVVAGVLADPTEGQESSVYEAMGYTRKSDRKSGLHRKAAVETQPKP
jgi:hypothetical protein